MRLGRPEPILGASGGYDDGVDLSVVLDGRERHDDLTGGFTGLVPSEYSSGQAVHRGRITKAATPTSAPS